MAPLLDGPRTPETLKTTASACLGRIRALLSGFGLTFDDKMIINSFHDWSAPEFCGGRLAQFEAFGAGKDELMGGAHSTWTAVRTSGLTSDQVIVEVQMITYAPKRR